MVPAITLPPTIPAACVISAGRDYAVPPAILVAIVKVESDGAAGTHRNTDGSTDVGITMINDRAWLPALKRQYGVERAAVKGDPCQAIRATAYIVRSEANRCGGDLWCGVGRYHSRTPSLLADYVRRVWRALQTMTETGEF
jgi:hypothetical protein